MSEIPLDTIDKLNMLLAQSLAVTVVLSNNFDEPQITQPSNLIVRKTLWAIQTMIESCEQELRDGLGKAEVSP